MKLGLMLGYSGARLGLPVERVQLAERLGFAYTKIQTRNINSYEHFLNQKDFKRTEKSGTLIIYKRNSS